MSFFKRLGILLLEWAPPVLGGTVAALLGALLAEIPGAVIGFLVGVVPTNWFWREYLLIQDDGNEP